jgi:hypothetical protein
MGQSEKPGDLRLMWRWKVQNLARSKNVFMASYQRCATNGFPAKRLVFLGLTQPMLDYYALHENEFKGQRFESIAGCIMQLAAGRNRGCQKKFMGALKG